MMGKIEITRALSRLELVFFLVVTCVLGGFAKTIFDHYRFESRLAEIPIMFDGIARAEFDFYTKPRLDLTAKTYPPCFLAAMISPMGPTPQRMPWSDSIGNFTIMGFSPRESVWFSYAVVAHAQSAGKICETPWDEGDEKPSTAVITAMSDQNGDRQMTILGLLKPAALYAETKRKSCAAEDAEAVSCPLLYGCDGVRSFFVMNLEATPGKLPRKGPLMVAETLKASEACAVAQP